MPYMWTRTLSAKMGFDEADFVKGFAAALNNTSVKKLLTELLIKDLRKEVGELRDLVKAKDNEIQDLKNRINELEDLSDCQEQYSRRNSLRISGISENDHEDIVQVSLDLFNEQLQLEPPVTITNIDRIHRTGEKVAGRTRPILVKFATYRERRRVIKARAKLRRPREDPTPPILSTRI